MSEFTICVPYRQTPLGVSFLSYAASLAELLSSEHLHVYAAGVQGADPSACQLSLIEQQRILEATCDATDLSRNRVIVAGGQYPDGAIVVDSSPVSGRNAFHCLNPGHETAVNRLGRKGPILIPFGNKDTGIRAARFGICLAEKLGVSVLFYHTTWMDRSVESGSAEDHMCFAAQEVFAAVKQLAVNSSVPFDCLIEAADDVAQGIARCAILKHSLKAGATAYDGEPVRPCLIVMARGWNVGIGSYVKQVMDLSATPCLAVASEAESVEDGEQL